MRKKILTVLLVLALISLTINLFAKDVYSDWYRCMKDGSGSEYNWPYMDQCKKSLGQECEGTEGNKVQCEEGYTCFCNRIG